MIVELHMHYLFDVFFFMEINFKYKKVDCIEVTTPYLYLGALLS